MPETSEPKKQELPRPTACGVQVFTWGTRPDGGNGVLNYFDTDFFGGNVGHAAVLITFPADKAGEELAKYCAENPVFRYRKKTIETKSSDNPDMPAFKEEVYEVYWSWWPGKTMPFAFSRSLEEDMQQEYSGYNFEWSDEWKRRLSNNPEQRKHSGKLGSTVMTYGPLNIIHERHLDKDDKRWESFYNQQKIKSANRNIEALNLLSKRFSKAENKFKTQGIKDYKVGKTEHLILDRFFPGWEKRVKDSQKISGFELGILLGDIIELSKKYEEELKNMELTIKPDKPITIERILNAEKSVQLLQGYIETSKALLAQDVGFIKSAMIALCENIEGYAEGAVFIQDIDKISKEEAEEYIEFLNNLAGLDAKQQNDANELAEYPDLFLVSGHPPEGVVSLPIAPIREGSVGVENGLNVRKMLEKMVDLVSHKEGEEFNLYTKNCSATVGTILESGAQQEYQKDFFRNKALGFFRTPQEAYNNAVEFQACFNEGKPSILSKIIAWNPIERRGGALIEAWMDPKTQGLKKVGVVIGLVALSPFVLVGFVGRKLMNPLESFKGAAGLMSYAFSRNSFGLKVLAVVTMGPLVALLALPAGAQTLIKAVVVDPIVGVAGWIKKSFKKAGAPELEDSSDKAVEEKKESEDKFGKAIQDVKVYVKAKNPEEALEEFENCLIADKNSIPLFSKEMQDRILKYIADAKHPKRKSLYIKLMDIASKRITKAQIGFRKGEPLKLTAKYVGAAQPVMLGMYQKERAMDPELESKIIQGVADLKVKISSEDPKTALLQFKKCLRIDENAIPVFDDKVKKKIEKYVKLKGHSSEQKLYELFKDTVALREEDAKKAVILGHPLQLFNKGKEAAKPKVEQVKLIQSNPEGLNT